MMTLSRLNDALFPKTFFNFENLFLDERNQRNQRNQRNHPITWPVMDATELADKYIVQVELPGIPQEDIDITYDNSILKISGSSSYEREVKEDATNSTPKYYIRERRQGNFSRAIRLLRNVDPDKISASMDNGVLTVEIPKAGNSSQKRIPIQVPKALE